MFRLICLLIGYAFGCIQSAYIAGRINGMDIRDHGSGNSGFTNATRVLGRKAGIMVFVADVAKTIGAFVVASLIFDGGGTFFYSNYVLPGLYAGLGAVLGHVFPVVLKFRGGKGIACTVAIVLMLDWRVALIIFGIGIVIVIVTRYISAASLFITLFTPVMMLVFGYGLEAVGITVILGALAWYLHRGNIQRLLNGTERKFSLARDKPEKS